MASPSAAGMRALYSHEVPSALTAGSMGLTSGQSSPVTLQTFMEAQAQATPRTLARKGIVKSHGGHGVPQSPSWRSPEFSGRRADFANTRKLEMALLASTTAGERAQKNADGALSRLMRVVATESSYMRGMRRRDRELSDKGNSYLNAVHQPAYACFYDGKGKYVFTVRTRSYIVSN